MAALLVCGGGGGGEWVEELK
jgi:hypothetical protein